MVFDMMYLNGEAATRQAAPPAHRHPRLDDQSNDVLQAEKGVMLDDPERSRRCSRMPWSAVSKASSSRRIRFDYQAGGAQLSWVKYKRHSRGALEDTIDCVMLGYFLGRGKRAESWRWSAACWRLRQGQRRVVTVTKIGTG